MYFLPISKFFFFNFSHGKRVGQKRKGRAISEQKVSLLKNHFIKNLEDSGKN